MLCISEDKPINNHLEEFNNIILSLRNIGVKIDDEDQTLIVLCSLPFSYVHFINIMLYEKDNIF